MNDTLLQAVCAAAAGIEGDVDRVAAETVDRLAPLLTTAERDGLIRRVIARLDGLDDLELHLADPSVDEVMVNAGGEVWVDRGGALERVGALAAGAIDVILERTLAASGKRLDRTNPIVDVRLADGARLCAVYDGISVGGSALSIRRHRRRRLPLAAWAESPAVLELLTGVVAAGCNVLVSGSTSTGKTTFVGSLLTCCRSGERLVVCEDTSELVIVGQHVVRLEARPASVDGLVGIDLATLVRGALRLRPDRLIIGEFRGPEVLAAVEAMNTGHDGSMATCHANSAVDALRRVETLLMQAAPAWPLPAIRRQVTRSIDVVVHLRRASSGARVIDEIAEVVESGDEPTVRRLATADAVVAAPRRARRTAHDTMVHQ